MESAPAASPVDVIHLSVPLQASSMSQQLLAYQECVHGISAKPGTNINTRLLSAKDYGEVQSPSH